MIFCPAAQRSDSPRAAPTIAVAGLLAAMLAGCATSSPTTGGKGRDGIDEIHLFGIPVALNLDGLQGADGIGVRVYASSAARAHGLPIQRGTLEILMFDGALGTKTETSAPKPRQVWSFPAADLKGYTATTSIGTGYQFALRWGASRPTSDNVSILARYRPPDGSVITSSSSTIAVSVK